jgi:hypothetical protein
MPRCRLPCASSLLAFAGAAVSIACGGTSDTPANELGQGQTLKVESASGLVTSEISAEGNHYAQGRNTFLVQFEPATTELVKASAFMPVHGHATPAPPGISMSGDIYRITDFILSIPGLWNVTLDVSEGMKSDKVEFTLDVP